MCLQFPSGSLPDGTKGGDGLGVDRHHPVSVLLDMCGRRLRPLLCLKVLEGVRESMSLCACILMCISVYLYVDLWSGEVSVCIYMYF